MRVWWHEGCGPNGLSTMRVVDHEGLVFMRVAYHDDHDGFIA